MGRCPSGRRARALVVAATAVLGAIFTATASEITVDRWQAVGPFGGVIESLAVSPSHPEIIYAGATSVGVFRSEDGGLSWQRTGLTLQSTVGDLAVDATNADTVYAATTSGVYVTEDGGTTWEPRNQGLVTLYMTSLAQDPMHSGTVYAGGWGGISRTVNGGLLWEDASSGLPEGVFVAALVLDWANPGTIYAATDRGVWKTENYALQWVNTSSGLGEDLLRDLVVDPWRPQTLYVATNSQGVWRSDDGAGSWARVWTPSDVSTFRLATGLISGMVIVGLQSGDIYRTSDWGETWYLWSDGLPSFSGSYALAVCPDDGTFLAGLFGEGVYRRGPDDGRWTPSHEGLSGYVLSAVLVDPYTQALYVGSSTYGATVFRSADGGQTWTRRGQGMFYPVVLSLVLHSSESNVLLSGNRGSLFSSVDGGWTWAPSDTGLPRGYVLVHALIRDPEDENVVVAGTNRGMWRSDDGGESWNPQGLQEATVLCLSWDETGLTLLAGTEVDGIYTSIDLGMTWSPLDAGPLTAPIHAILALSERVYVACGEYGLYESEDPAAGWNPVSLHGSIPGAFSLLRTSHSAFSVVVGTDSGVFALDARLNTWTQVSNPLPEGSRIASLAYDTINSRLYAGGLGGLFVIELP